MPKSHPIAVTPGDGIGDEVVPMGQEILEATGRRPGGALKWTALDWSCKRVAGTGRMMPEDGLEELQTVAAIYLGAVGYPGFPDHVSLWSLLIPIRRGLDQMSSPPNP